MAGESWPKVVTVPPVAVIVPPPRSVAIAPELAPAVEMLTLVRTTVPPPLAIAPWAYWPVSLIVTFEAVMVDVP